MKPTQRDDADKGFIEALESALGQTDGAAEVSEAHLELSTMDRAALGRAAVDAEAMQSASRPLARFEPRINAVAARAIAAYQEMAPPPSGSRRRKRG